MEEPFTKEEFAGMPVKAKIRAGKRVVRKAFDKHGTENSVIGFTGGKDSTLTAYIVKQVCEENGFDKPDFMFIDHGQHFQEIEDYVERISDEWGFNVVTLRNDDLIDKADQPGDEVHIDQLNERNRREVQSLDAEKAPWLMDTEVGNHLLKTVPMHQFIEKEGVELVINGIRWDEHESREDENFYSQRSQPDHIRIHPILQFTEKDVWVATWDFMVPDITEYEGGMPESREVMEVDGIGLDEVPVNPKYWDGFRSLGSEVSTDASDDKPAWMQDVQNTDERGGRAQNKDSKDIMTRLRKHGYM